MSMQQIKLKIRFYGDRVLRRRAVPVDSVGQEEKAVFAEMEELMRVSAGVGLAAPQVGLSLQMIVVDVGDGLVALANPRILKKWGSSVLEEGCLSLPGVYVSVRRASRIKVSGLNEKNEKVSFVADGLLARVLQHEIDHLRGKMIIDYSSIFNKLRLKEKLKKALKAPERQVA